MGFFTSINDYNFSYSNLLNSREFNCELLGIYVTYCNIEYYVLCTNIANFFYFFYLYFIFCVFLLDELYPGTRPLYRIRTPKTNREGKCILQLSVHYPTNRFSHPNDPRS